MALGLGFPLGLTCTVPALVVASASTQWDGPNSTSGWAVSGTGNTVATWASGSSNAIIKATVANAHSGTGDWSYTVVTSGGSNAILGLCNASESMANFLGQTNNSIGWQRSTGDILRNGSAALSTGVTWSDGDTITIRLKNGNLYIAKNGTYIGTMNPTAETGGVSCSTMGNLMPACYTNNNEVFTADFTNWP